MSITIEEFRKIAENKKVYVLSTNLEGTGFIKLFKSMGLDVGGFVDSRTFKSDIKCDVRIIHPDEFFGSLVQDAVLIIAAKHRKTRKWAFEESEKNGLKEGTTLFASTDLCDYFPTIEIAGKCNLKCISCNMGLPGANKGGGYMSKEVYREVLTKMKKDIPFLNSVYLYTWGEPLLAPDIDEVIKISTELGVASEISTNLSVKEELVEKTIKADPDVFVIPCSGVGEKFEKTRTGGDWELFKSNLYKVREFIDKYGVDTTVRVHYHMYNNNLDEDYDAIMKICEELDYQFSPMVAQIFPEYILKNVLYNQPIPKEMKEADDLLYFSTKDQLEYAKKVKNRICFMKKVFPVVSWDAKVRHCCNLEFPVLSHDYVNISLDELLKIREENKFCDKCMDHGLHRYFDVSVTVNTVDGKRVLERD